MSVGDPETLVPPAAGDDPTHGGKYLAFSDEPDELIPYPETPPPEPEPQEITMSLIMRRSLLGKTADYSSDQKADFISEMTHLRLDRENIRVIDNLDCFSTTLTHLYLQSNLIEYVSGLTDLKKLVFLCLSNNRIKVLDIEQLPESIIIIYFNGNPCADAPTYPFNVISRCTRLKMVDDMPVSAAFRSHAEKVMAGEAEPTDAPPRPAISSDESGSSGEEGSGSDSEGTAAEKPIVPPLGVAGQDLLESDLEAVSKEVEKLLTGQQIGAWKQTYQNVEAFSSSEEEAGAEETNADEATAGKKKSKKKSKKALGGGKMKTDRERKQLKEMGINPAHFRDLTVKLLGRSRVRQSADVKSHDKRCGKIDTFRDEVKQVQSERLEITTKFRLPKEPTTARM